MNVEFTDEFKKKTQQLIRKNPQLKSSFKKQFILFKINPFHPSLRLHKLKGSRSEQYVIWIKGDLRALSIKPKTDTETYIFFDLVTHGEY